jgi:hypothetical protein
MFFRDPMDAGHGLEQRRRLDMVMSGERADLMEHIAFPGKLRMENALQETGGYSIVVIILIALIPRISFSELREIITKTK